MSIMGEFWRPFLIKMLKINSLVKTHLQIGLVAPLSELKFINVDFKSHECSNLSNKESKS